MAIRRCFWEVFFLKENVFINYAVLTVSKKNGGTLNIVQSRFLKRDFDTLVPGVM